MRWRNNRRSTNIEDNRGMSPSGFRGSSGGLLRLLPVLFRFLGFKGTAIVVAGFIGYNLITGGNLGSLLGAALTPQTVSSGNTNQQPIQETKEEKELVDFVSVVLADTEDTWTTIFHQHGMTYKAPKLVLFRGLVNSACGLAQSATGPFYCPGDQKVYIDLSFYDQLKKRFKAPGDFAQAYVIAHEIGHHVQTLTGLSTKVHQARRQLNHVEGNKLSVRQELQADCLAGVWANHANQTRHLLEAGDLEEGLTAATAIGDDTLQRQATGHVRPDSFTHGTSQQRVKWFKTGFLAGTLSACETFKNPQFHLLKNKTGTPPQKR